MEVKNGDLIRRSHGKNGLKSAPDRAECVEALDIPDPTPAYETVTDPETRAEEEKETDEHAEWNMKLTFARRNITYNNRYDRDNKETEVGYIHHVHYYCGLDVVLQIHQISEEFQRNMFGTSDDFGGITLLKDMNIQPSGPNQMYLQRS